MLQTVDAVSDDMRWNCSGYCGKKQLMVVSLGGMFLMFLAFDYAVRCLGQLLQYTEWGVLG